MKASAAECFGVAQDSSPPHVESGKLASNTVLGDSTSEMVISRRSVS